MTRDVAAGKTDAPAPVPGAIPPAPVQKTPLLNQWRESLDDTHRRIGSGGDLPPAEILPALQAEIQATLEPALSRYSLAVVTGLVASYPQAPPAHLDGYMAAFLEEMAEYPADVLRETVREVRRKSRWLPTIAELVEIADRHIALRRSRLLMLPRITKEHERRAELAAATKAQAQESHDRTMRLKELFGPDAPDDASFQIASRFLNMWRFAAKSTDPHEKWELGQQHYNKWLSALSAGEKWAADICRIAAAHMQRHARQRFVYPPPEQAAEMLRLLEDRSPPIEWPNIGNIVALLIERGPERWAETLDAAGAAWETEALRHWPNQAGFAERSALLFQVEVLRTARCLANAQSNLG